MMIRRSFLVSLLVILLGVSVYPAHASFDELTVDLAQDHVDITTGFGGANLVLFGTKKLQTGAVAVVVRGPEKDMVVRKKGRVAGVWMNSDSTRFKNVPGYYEYAVSENISKYAGSDVLLKQGIGLPSLLPQIRPEKITDERFQFFAEALIRNKVVEGVFLAEPKNVELLNDHLFKTELYIPANVPKGEYTIETFVFFKNKVHEKSVTTLEVRQIGLGAGIYNFSRMYGFAYGLICVSIAVLAGWAINAIRKTT